MTRTKFHIFAVTMIVSRNTDPILIMTPNVEWSPESLIRIEPLVRRSPSSYSTNVTFGWSDFPCQGEVPIYEKDIVLSDQATTVSSSSLLSDYIPPPLYKQPLVSPPSPTSCCTIEEEEEEEEMPPSKFPSDLPISSSTAASTIAASTRRVRFAPLARVRTHTLVLGDHPLCTGGMALQLGWESAGTQYQPLRNRPSPHLTQFRLSYAERRHRLQQLTGMTGSQLLHEEYLLVCCGGGDASRQESI